MSRLELYQELYDHEKDSNAKMLAMINSVPADSRSDARFQRAISIAGHLVACRENWLDRMVGKELHQADWNDEKCDFAALRPRFTAADSQWADYLTNLNEDSLEQDFEFSEGDERFRLPTEVQIVQLFGHASYHRGQIALLVDQLGGEVADTDYVDWWWTKRERERETEEKEMR